MSEIKKKANIVSMLEEKLGLGMLYFGLLEYYNGGNSSNSGMGRSSYTGWENRFEMNKLILCTTISHTTHL